MNSPPPQGVHDQTFVLRRLIELHGAADPPSEAWLLGMGGGVGFQAVTFEYRDTPPVFYLGTRCAHQYAHDAGFLKRAAAGVGFDVQVKQKAGRKKGAALLDAALERGPVIAWVGLETLLGVPATLGETPWVVVVRARTGDSYVVEDVNAGCITVDARALSTARKSVKEAKNRILSITDTASPEPAAAVYAAVARCVAELDGADVAGGSRKRFGLAALERWARQANSSGQKGWRTRFADGENLLCGLRQAYGWIERATGGGAFRPLYARFLRQAADVTGDGRFVEAATVFDENGACWSALSARMMDASVPLLREGRSMIDAAPWPEPMAPVHRWSTRFDELPEDWAADFYPDLAERLSDLHARELRAKELLASIVA